MGAERADELEVSKREVEFFSDDLKLRGILRVPTSRASDSSGVVFAPGWLGLAESSATSRWLDAFAASGCQVLSFDYRGFGASEGERGQVRPDWQLEDIRNGVTFLSAQPEVDPLRIGIFGKGGTGGGNAFLAAAVDERVSCVVAMTPVANGATWLRGMRREYEWREFWKRVSEAERQRVVDGVDPKVDPRAEIMIAAPERATAPGKAGVDAKVGQDFRFSTAAHILRYRPVDFAARLRGRPVFLIGIDEDVVTPIQHARALFDALGGAPRQLVVLRGVAHYAADDLYFPAVSQLAVEWMSRFLRPRHEVSTADLTIDEVLYPAAPADLD